MTSVSAHYRHDRILQIFTVVIVRSVGIRSIVCSRHNRDWSVRLDELRFLIAGLIPAIEIWERLSIFLIVCGSRNWSLSALLGCTHLMSPVGLAPFRCARWNILKRHQPCNKTCHQHRFRSPWVASSRNGAYPHRDGTLIHAYCSWLHLAQFARLNRLLCHWGDGRREVRETNDQHHIIRWWKMLSSSINIASWTKRISHENQRGTQRIRQNCQV